MVLLKSAQNHSKPFFDGQQVINDVVLDGGHIL
jgi:hypothetical protein